MLELKDKLGAMRPVGAVAAPATSSAQPDLTGALSIVHGALVQMGFKALEADTACDRIQSHSEGKPAEELLREALSVLG
jgi:Holliday junction resolvasome RuvABC DNA-binding subunit